MDKGERERNSWDSVGKVVALSLPTWKGWRGRESFLCPLSLDRGLPRDHRKIWKWVSLRQATQRVGSCLTPEEAETVQGGMMEGDIGMGPHSLVRMCQWSLWSRCEPKGFASGPAPEGGLWGEQGGVAQGPGCWRWNPSELHSAFDLVTKIEGRTSWL